MSKADIWIIGASSIAIDYAKILKSLGKDFVVIGRGEANAKVFEEATGQKPLTGGIEKVAAQLAYVPQFAINLTGVEKLGEINKFLINAGVKNILSEKPGAVSAEEIEQIKEMVLNMKCNFLIAYNRRFYASVIAAENIIKADGSIRSFNFEFTEWSHVIEKLTNKPRAVLNNWFLANSTHVIDLAFYLGGVPKEIACFTAGKDKLDWHPGASNFSGAGTADGGALFTYHANWCAPGRFSVEVLTDKHRLIFRPLEKLQIQNIGSVVISEAESIDYSLDDQYKPGLYLQTKAFLEKDSARFCTINDQAKHMKFYTKMRGF